MDSADEAWEKFTKAYEQTKKSASVSEKLDVIAAQLNKIQADTEQIPDLANSEAAAQADNMSAQLQAGPMGAMPQDAMAGAAQPGMDQTGADGGQAGGQDLLAALSGMGGSQPVAASANKKHLRSKSTIQKGDMEKATGISDGLEQVSTGLEDLIRDVQNQLRAGAGQNREESLRMIRLLQVLKELQSEEGLNMEGSSVAKAGTKNSRGEQSTTEKVRRQGTRAIPNARTPARQKKEAKDPRNKNLVGLGGATEDALKDADKSPGRANIVRRTLLNSISRELAYLETVKKYISTEYTADDQNVIKDRIAEIYPGVGEGEGQISVVDAVNNMVNWLEDAKEYLTRPDSSTEIVVAIGDGYAKHTAYLKKIASDPASTPEQVAAAQSELTNMEGNWLRIGSTVKTVVDKETGKSKPVEVVQDTLNYDGSDVKGGAKAVFEKELPSGEDAPQLAALHRIWKIMPGLIELSGTKYTSDLLSKMSRLRLDNKAKKEKIETIGKVLPYCAEGHLHILGSDNVREFQRLADFYDGMADEVPAPKAGDPPISLLEDTCIKVIELYFNKEFSRLTETLADVDRYSTLKYDNPKYQPNISREAVLAEIDRADAQMTTMLLSCHKVISMKVADYKKAQEEYNQACKSFQNPDDGEARKVIGDKWLKMQEAKEALLPYAHGVWDSFVQFGISENLFGTTKDESIDKTFRGLSIQNSPISGAVEIFAHTLTPDDYETSIKEVSRQADMGLISPITAQRRILHLKQKAEEAKLENKDIIVQRDNLESEKIYASALRPPGITFEPIKGEGDAVIGVRAVPVADTARLIALNNIQTRLDHLNEHVLGRKEKHDAVTGVIDAIAGFGMDLTGKKIRDVQTRDNPSAEGLEDLVSQLKETVKDYNTNLAAYQTNQFYAANKALNEVFGKLMLLAQNPTLEYQDWINKSPEFAQMMRVITKYLQDMTDTTVRPTDEDELDQLYDEKPWLEYSDKDRTEHSDKYRKGTKTPEELRYKAVQELGQLLSGMNRDKLQETVNTQSEENPIITAAADVRGTQDAQWDQALEEIPYIQGLHVYEDLVRFVDGVPSAMDHRKSEDVKSDLLDKLLVRYKEEGAISRDDPILSKAFDDRCDRSMQVVDQAIANSSVGNSINVGLRLSKREGDLIRGSFLRAYVDALKGALMGGEKASDLTIDECQKISDRLADKLLGINGAQARIISEEGVVAGGDKRASLYNALWREDGLLETLTKDVVSAYNDVYSIPAKIESAEEKVPGFSVMFEPEHRTMMYNRRFTDNVIRMKNFRSHLEEVLARIPQGEKADTFLNRLDFFMNVDETDPRLGYVLSAVVGGQKDRTIDPRIRLVVLYTHFMGPLAEDIQNSFNNNPNFKRDFYKAMSEIGINPGRNPKPIGSSFAFLDRARRYGSHEAILRVAENNAKAFNDGQFIPELGQAVKQWAEEAPEKVIEACSGVLGPDYEYTPYSSYKTPINPDDVVIQLAEQSRKLADEIKDMVLAPIEEDANGYVASLFPMGDPANTLYTAVDRTGEPMLVPPGDNRSAAWGSSENRAERLTRSFNTSANTLRGVSASDLGAISARKLAEDTHVKLDKKEFDKDEEEEKESVDVEGLTALPAMSFTNEATGITTWIQDYEPNYDYVPVDPTQIFPHPNDAWRDVSVLPEDDAHKLMSLDDVINTYYGGDRAKYEETQARARQTDAANYAIEVDNEIRDRAKALAAQHRPKVNQGQDPLEDIDGIISWLGSNSEGARTHSGRYTTPRFEYTPRIDAMDLTSQFPLLVRAYYAEGDDSVDKALESLLGVSDADAIAGIDYTNDVYMTDLEQKNLKAMREAYKERIYSSMDAVVAGMKHQQDVKLAASLNTMSNNEGQRVKLTVSLADKYHIPHGQVTEANVGGVIETLNKLIPKRSSRLTDKKAQVMSEVYGQILSCAEKALGAAHIKPASMEAYTVEVSGPSREWGPGEEETVYEPRYTVGDVKKVLPVIVEYYNEKTPAGEMISKIRDLFSPASGSILDKNNTRLDDLEGPEEMQRATAHLGDAMRRASGYLYTLASLNGFKIPRIGDAVDEKQKNETFDLATVDTDLWANSANFVPPAPEQISTFSKFKKYFQAVDEKGQPIPDTQVDPFKDPKRTKAIAFNTAVEEEVKQQVRDIPGSRFLSGNETLMRSAVKSMYDGANNWNVFDQYDQMGDLVIDVESGLGAKNKNLLSSTNIRLGGALLTLPEGLKMEDVVEIDPIIFDRMTKILASPQGSDERKVMEKCAGYVKRARLHTAKPGMTKGNTSKDKWDLGVLANILKDAAADLKKGQQWSAVMPMLREARRSRMIALAVNAKDELRKCHETISNIKALQARIAFDESTEVLGNMAFLELPGGRDKKGMEHELSEQIKLLENMLDTKDFDKVSQKDVSKLTEFPELTRFSKEGQAFLKAAQKDPLFRAVQTKVGKGVKRDDSTMPFSAEEITQLVDNAVGDKNTTDDTFKRSMDRAVLKYLPRPKDMKKFAHELMDNLIRAPLEAKAVKLIQEVGSIDNIKISPFQKKILTKIVRNVAIGDMVSDWDVASLFLGHEAERGKDYTNIGELHMAITKSPFGALADACKAWNDTLRTCPACKDPISKARITGPLRANLQERLKTQFDHPTLDDVALDYVMNSDLSGEVKRKAYDWYQAGNSKPLQKLAQIVDIQNVKSVMDELLDYYNVNPETQEFAKGLLANATPVSDPVLSNEDISEGRTAEELRAELNKQAYPGKPLQLPSGELMVDPETWNKFVQMIWTQSLGTDGVMHKILTPLAKELKREGYSDKQLLNFNPDANVRLIPARMLRALSQPVSGLVSSNGGVDMLRLKDLASRIHMDSNTLLRKIGSAMLGVTDVSTMPIKWDVLLETVGPQITSEDSKNSIWKAMYARYIKDHAGEKGFTPNLSKENLSGAVVEFIEKYEALRTAFSTLGYDHGWAPMPGQKHPVYEGVMEEDEKTPTEKKIQSLLGQFTDLGFDTGKKGREIEEDGDDGQKKLYHGLNLYQLEQWASPIINVPSIKKYKGITNLSKKAEETAVQGLKENSSLFNKAVLETFLKLARTHTQYKIKGENKDSDAWKVDGDKKDKRTWKLNKDKPAKPVKKEYGSYHEFLEDKAFEAGLADNPDIDPDKLSDAEKQRVIDDYIGQVRYNYHVETADELEKAEQKFQRDRDKAISSKEASNKPLTFVSILHTLSDAIMDGLGFSHSHGLRATPRVNLEAMDSSYRGQDADKVWDRILKKFDNPSPEVKSLYAKIDQYRDNLAKGKEDPMEGIEALTADEASAANAMVAYALKTGGTKQFTPDEYAESVANLTGTEDMTWLVPEDSTNTDLNSLSDATTDLLRSKPKAITGSNLGQVENEDSKVFDSTKSRLNNFTKLFGRLRETPQSVTPSWVLSRNLLTGGDEVKLSPNLHIVHDGKAYKAADAFREQAKNHDPAKYGETNYKNLTSAAIAGILAAPGKANPIGDTETKEKDVKTADDDDI